MRDIVLELLSSYGYAGMFALILIENLFPPIPSEVILTFGGFMTTYTRMNIAGAVLAATAGSVLGALILYELGRHIPVQKFYAFLGGAWGKRLGVEVEDVKDADGWLERTGRSAVFFLPVRSDHPKPDLDSGGDGKDGTAAVSPSDNSGQSYLEYGAHRSRRGGGGIVGTYSGAVKNIFPLRRDGSGNLGICGGECVFSETITTGE